MSEKRTSSEGTEVLVIPPLREPQRQTSSNPVIAICGQCGREVRALGGYSCSDARCPLQTQVFYSMTVDYGRGDVTGPHYGVMEIPNATEKSA